MAGVMPIIFASVLFVIPTVVFKWLGWITLENIFQDSTGFIYVAVYLVLIFSFCFFWNRLMFQPEDIANNLREHGSFIPGIRPGQKTADYLSNVLTRVTLAGAAFLAVVAVLPAFITKDSGMTQSMEYFVTGTSDIDRGGGGLAAHGQASGSPGHEDLRRPRRRPRGTTPGQVGQVWWQR